MSSKIVWSPDGGWTDEGPEVRVTLRESGRIAAVPAVNKPMCESHRAQFLDWSGGKDGWGPHNPIPKGVTMKLADEQRAAIKRSCTDGKGCSR